MTDQLNAVDTKYINGAWYSASHPNHAVVFNVFTELFTLYEQDQSDPTQGSSRGITDQTGAFQWLNGESLDSIKRYTVAVECQAKEAEQAGDKKP